MKQRSGFSIELISQNSEEFTMLWVVISLILAGFGGRWKPCSSVVQLLLPGHLPVPSGWAGAGSLNSLHPSKEHGFTFGKVHCKICKPLKQTGALKLLIENTCPFHVGPTLEKSTVWACLASSSKCLWIFLYEFFRVFFFFLWFFSPNFKKCHCAQKSYL